MQLLSVLSLFVFRVSISFYFRRSCLLFTFYCHFGLLLIVLELFFPSHILLQLICIYYPYLFSNFKRLCCSWIFCIIVGSHQIISSLKKITSGSHQIIFLASLLMFFLIFPFFFVTVTIVHISVIVNLPVFNSCYYLCPVSGSKSPSSRTSVKFISVLSFRNHYRPMSEHSLLYIHRFHAMSPSFLS